METIAKCQCSGCGRFFNGTRTFEMHRRELKCLPEADLRNKMGLATEQRHIRLWREGREYFELHNVYYCVTDRERLAASHS